MWREYFDVLKCNYKIKILQHTGPDLSRVYPTCCPVTGGIGSSPLCKPELRKWKNMDGWRIENDTV